MVVLTLRERGFLSQTGRPLLCVEGFVLGSDLSDIVKASSLEKEINMASCNEYVCTLEANAYEGLVQNDKNLLVFLHTNKISIRWSPKNSPELVELYTDDIETFRLLRTTINKKLGASVMVCTRQKR